MSATPALLLAAGGVGAGHAVMPDHWMPLAIVSRTRRYSLARVARLSTIAGLAHVAVSIVLGAVIVAVGLQLRGSVESAQSAIVGSLLLATGVIFLVFELSGHGHHHSHDGDHQPKDHPNRDSLLSLVVSFGVAASPDLTILPVFLAAAAVSVGAAVGSVVVFALVTVATFVVLTLVATIGGYQLGDRLEKRGGIVTAGLLIVLGVLVLVGAI